MKPTLSFALALCLGAVALCGAVAQAAPVEAGFTSIFNGTDLSGWDGNPKFWSVEDGAITGRTTPDNPTRGNTFIIWKEGALDNFELRLSYRMVGGNSGIQYRSKVVDQNNWVVGGYQADIESGTTFTGILYEERGRGILAKRGELTLIDNDPANPDKFRLQVLGSLGSSDEIQGLIKQEQWNDYIIVAHGNELTHIINGRVTAHVIDLDTQRAAQSGILALQLHAGPPMTVQFKNIRLRKL